MKTTMKKKLQLTTETVVQLKTKTGLQAGETRPSYVHTACGCVLPR